MCLPKSCCCIYSLRTGTKLTGWIYLVLNILIFILTIFVIIVEKNNVPVKEDILIITAIFSVINGISYVILLCGVYKEKVRFIQFFFSIIINSIFLFILTYLGLMDDVYDLELLIGFVIFDAIQICCMTVVCSYVNFLLDCGRNVNQGYAISTL